jgi:Spy/CpxP family protein refolding chaperone
MSRTWGRIGLALALGLGVTALPLEAQRGMRGGAGMGAAEPGAGPNVGRSLEIALENREALELDGEQVSRLQEVQGHMDAEVTPLAEEMRTLRSELWDGDVDRDEGLRRMQELRGRLLVATAPVRGRVQEILTVEQHRELQALVRQERPAWGRGRGGGTGGGGMGMAPRGGALRGPVGRTGPGMRRGGMAAPGRAGAFRGRAAGFRGPGGGMACFGYTRGRALPGRPGGGFFFRGGPAPFQAPDTVPGGGF